VRATGQFPVFGRRREPHTIIIARGDQIRHFTIRPWFAALAGSAFFAIAIGYLLATSYLVLRDDLIGASLARQARMQQAYEDRIKRLSSSASNVCLSLGDQIIQTPGFHISFNLAIPGIVEIDLCESL
jgi:hypothetical protein